MKALLIELAMIYREVFDPASPHNFNRRVEGFLVATFLIATLVAMVLVLPFLFIMLTGGL